MASRENARRFHFIREIASGGFGTVYLCKVVHADGFSRLAAVKLLKAQWTESVEVVRRIRDEARLLGILRHRNIITVSDLTSIDGRTAVVMEFVEGVDLRTVVHHLAAQGQILSARAALEITAAVASALDAAYNRPPLPGEKPLRVIHRDIKPSNIMIDRQGEVKVLDFGVARSDLANRESHTEELQFGSVDYMAPERLFFEPETPAGDVYALGATLFELVALEKLGKAKGRPEQHTANVEDRLSFLRARVRVRGTVATELTELIRACVAFEHERRPTAADLYQRARALSRMIDSEELQPWAERVVPPLVLLAESNPAPASGLTDSVMTEDSVSRGFTDQVAPPQALALGAQVRQGALRELDDSSERQAPVQPQRAPTPLAASLPVVAPDEPLLEPVAPDPGAALIDVSEDHADEWTEGPTYVGPIDPPPAEAPSSSSAATVVPELLDELVTIAPATGAPGARGKPDAPPLRQDGDIGPGYESEATALGSPDLAAQRSVSPVSAQDQASSGRGQPAAKPAGRMRAVAVGGLAGGCLLAVVTAMALGAGAWWWGQRAVGPVVKPPDDSLAVIAAPEPAEDVPSVTAAQPVPTRTLAFESLASNTRKLTVRCIGGEAKGSTRAEVALAASDRCMVTAIMTDRSRHVAVVNQAQAGAYVCFAKGDDSCQRQ
ncbi:MAG: protein kinase [Oligoflexia bacterium]|nr:protein kinase [Oligoflexia bacterium]